MVDLQTARRRDIRTLTRLGCVVLAVAAIQLFFLIAYLIYGQIPILTLLLFVSEISAAAVIFGSRHMIKNRLKADAGDRNA